MRFMASLLAGAALVALALPVYATRLALVVGVNNYAGFGRDLQLRNAENDAEALAGALRGAGFKIEGNWLLKSPGKRQMEDAINSLAARVQPGDEVLFYFSGHGVEIGRIPLMLPGDVRDPAKRYDGSLRSPDKREDVYEANKQVQGDSISLQSVANQLAGRNPRLSMVIVDACRNNPVIDLLRMAQLRGSKDIGGGEAPGFAAMESGAEQVVVFAAGKGQEALDRLGPGDSDPNGVFARVLLQQVRLPGRELREVLSALRDEVPRLASRRVDDRGQPHQQTPVLIGSVLVPFYFIPAAAAAEKPPAAPAVSPRVQVAQAPSGGGLDIDDLEKQQAVRKQWQQWQAGMKAAFDKVAGFDDTAEAKVVAWDRYLSAYAQDNPFSAEDEMLRAQAQAKRGAAAGEAEKQKAEAARQQQMAQQAAEEASRRAREEEARRRREAELGPGKVFRDCAGCPEMVVIPSGSYEMGSPPSEADRRSNEGPQHRVSVGTFALGKTEVTQGQWRALMGSNPSHFSSCGDDCPVEQVSWNDAQAYVKKLSEKTGKGYRLPSEAEWEYAARAGTTTAFYTGSCVNTSQANYDGNYDYANCGAKTGTYRNKTMAVASFAPNRFGLYDMIGNVWEWVEDCYHENYSGAPTDGSARTSGCSESDRRVLRGGSWYSLPQSARSANRDGDAREGRGSSSGFRPARMLP